MPGGDAVQGDWWTSGGVGMWWCDGAPAPSRWVFEKGQLRAAAGPKAGLCLCSTDEALPTPKPPVPADPVNHTVSCPQGCRGPPCSRYPYCNRALSAQARAEDLVSRLSLQEKANGLMWVGAGVARLRTPAIAVGEAQYSAFELILDHLPRIPQPHAPATIRGTGSACALLDWRNLIGACDPILYCLCVRFTRRQARIDQALYRQKGRVLRHPRHQRVPVCHVVPVPGWRWRSLQPNVVQRDGASDGG